MDLSDLEKIEKLAPTRNQTQSLALCHNCLVCSEGLGGYLVVSSSVAEHWQLKPGVLGLIPGGCWLFTFLYFCVKKDLV